MKTASRILLLFWWGICCIGCRSARVATEEEIRSLRLIGYREIPMGMQYAGTTFGGISGIDWEGHATYFLISDDKGSETARIYKARIDFDQNGLHDFRLTGIIRLQLPFSDPNLDAESVRYQATTGDLLWINEGNKNHSVPPALHRSDTLGRYLGQIPLPKHYRYTAGQETGLRQDKSLESLSLAPNPDHLWLMNEEPLYEDGAPVTFSPEPPSPLRLSLIHQTTGELLAQYAYVLDPLVGTPGQKAQPVNTVPEVLANSAHTLLVLERMYLGSQCNHIRIYAVDTRQALDIRHLPALRQAAYQPLPKRLVLDFNQLADFCADNIEGMTFGPRLSNGNRSLILVADDNFNPKGQKTQVVVFEVVR